MTMRQPRPDNWYPHDLYVNFADTLCGKDLEEVEAAVADVVAHLSTTGQRTVSTIGHGNRPAGKPTEAAIMIVFLTPGFDQETACWDEAKQFHDEIVAGIRSGSQLVICEFLPYPAEQQASLPWAIRPGASPGSRLQLFNPNTRRAFSSEELVAKHRGLLSNDIAWRMANLRERKAASAAVLQPRRRSTPLGQAYLMEYANGTLWQHARSQLLGDETGLIIHPEHAPGDQPNVQQRKQLRKIRRRLLENCRGYLLLHGDENDDLTVIAADVLADLDEAEVDIPAICIDWIGTPQHAWPSFFRPQIIDARPLPALSEGPFMLRREVVWPHEVHVLLSRSDNDR